MKKLLLLVLCLSMLLSATVGLVSCKKDGDGSSESSGDLDEENVLSDPIYADLVKVDYSAGGVPADFNIFASKSYESTMDVSELTGVQYDDAVVMRNQFIESQLGISINEKVVKSTAEGRDTMRSIHSAGLYDYDICYMEGWMQSVLALEGIYKSLDSYSENLNLDKPWWFADVISDMTVMDKCFVVAGDMHLGVYDMIWCLGYNKEILTDLGLEDPYNLVQSGEWTFENFYKLSIDSKMEGKYGIVSHYQLADALMVGADLRLAEKNSDGELSVASFGDRFTTIYQTMVSYFFNNNGLDDNNCIKTMSDTAKYMENNKFAGFNQGDSFVGGNAAFYAGVTGDMRSKLPVSEVDYGFAPIPKYERDQAQYISWISRPAALCAIPSNIDSQAEGTLERVSNIMEWLGACSYKFTKPVYYDTIIHGRIAKHPESAEMLDVIFGTDERGAIRIELDATLDLGMTALLEQYASDCKPNISAGLSSKGGAVEAAIDSLHEYYKKA